MVQPIVIQENLLVKCPNVLPPVSGLTGKDWVKMAQDWSNQYYDCAIRHNGLVDVVK